ncbi:hypothetical protein PS838_04406 [Pseudomonas fluorescens]|nr:hypothetical protein PS838_04406 [Pseudomonas fluorescens]
MGKFFPVLRESLLVSAVLSTLQGPIHQRPGHVDHVHRRKGQMPVGALDAESGLVHSLVGTAANVADVTQDDQLLHGEEIYVCSDAGYTSKEYFFSVMKAGSSQFGPLIVRPFASCANFPSSIRRPHTP